MSSGITSTDHMVYLAREGAPWHQIGTEIGEFATIPEMRAAAHLMWDPVLLPLQFQLPDETWRVTTERVMVRNDTHEVLDVVGGDYEPASNEEVLLFFEQYLATGDMKLSTAGSLWGGKYVWGLANLNREFELAGGDKVSGRMLVANANKYGRGLIVKFVSERVVCANTMAIALAESGGSVSVPHNAKFDETRRRDALEKIGLAQDAFARTQYTAEAFADLPLATSAVNRVLAASFRLQLEDDEIVKETRAVKRVRELYEGAGSGAQMVSALGTGWGLLNAVTQYVDHEYGKTADARLRHSWFDTGGPALKNRAVKAIWQEHSTKEKAK